MAMISFTIWRVDPCACFFNSLICTQSLPGREVSGIEIAVSGTVIRVAPGFDPRMLAQVVEVLRSC
jgi:hypothetical protein